ncbi:uncharacterized protein EV420DRAFT_1642316 [Desarmillaria tabescens]|uniref:DUF6534 domain-containing protein n=1 Tax=Armillaria tabescens TaxID=1929756 RepID=A0AA39KDV2_ARMTA|nr:uncharacterized protein EV420DRAFT_1642316 [Desarmillaria tabescens]KAK0459351.1 hypothetical protein EV420DRAFT_1642316 [Desarmillaria tabescens]
MQPVPAGYPIEKLSGPAIVAYLLHWGLFGTLTVQLYLYYLAFPNDRRFTKYLVYGIYVIEFAQTILVTYDAFAGFGYGFGDIEALTRMYFNWLIVPIMGAVVASIVQCFYAYRIFILSKSQIVTILVTCLSLTSAVAAIITGTYCFEAGDVTKLNNRRTSIAVGIFYGASALCDILIAICMTYYLMRCDTGFRRTRMLLTKLIRLIIETGTVTAGVAVLDLILFFSFPHETFYGTTALVMPKLYANTFYMVLNSRIRILGGRDTYTSSTDLSITTTMIKDITSKSTEGTQRTDGMQGQASLVAITQQVFNDDLEMSQMDDKPRDTIMSPAV